MRDAGQQELGTRRRRMHRRWLAVGAAVAIVVSGVAAVPDAAATGAATTTIHDTAKTVLVPPLLIKQQLVSVSKNGATYTFRSKRGALAKLRSGKVMLLSGLAVRDVTKTASKRGRFIVITRPAKITDVIANGKISWNHAVSFAKGFVIGGSAVPVASAPGGNSAPGGSSGATQPALSTSVPARFGMIPLAGSGDKGITLKGKTKSYSYSVNFKTTTKALAVTITIGKSTPIDLEVSITGSLDNLKTAGTIAVKNSKLTSAKMLANNLQGSFKLGYSAKPISAFGLGNAGGIKITLPAEIAVPIPVGPLPFYLGVKVAFFASAGFSGFDQALSGSYTLSYDGQGGFTTSRSGATTPAGVLKGLGKIVLGAGNAVANGPLSFIFGAQMPQLELGLGVKGLNIAGNVTLIGNTGIATYGSGCDTRQLELQGVAGADASFFGFSADLASAQLFDKKVQASWPTGCGTFPRPMLGTALGG